MVVALTILVVGSVAVTVVALLIVSRCRPQPPPAGRDGQQGALVAAREAALRAIRDLDAGYQLGSLTEADYRQLRQRHTLEAINAIALLHVSHGHGRSQAVIDDPLEAEIERRVRAARARRRSRRHASASEDGGMTWRHAS